MSRPKIHIQAYKGAGLWSLYVDPFYPRKKRRTSLQSVRYFNFSQALEFLNEALCHLNLS